MNTLPFPKYHRYYERKLEDAKSNTHATWKILNEVLKRKKPRLQLNTILNSDDQEISDPVEVANRFCSYFSSTGPNLAKKIQPSPSPNIDFLSGSFRELIFLAQQQRMKLLPLLNFLPPGTPLETIIFKCL